MTTDQSVLRVGDGFDGCLLEGPNFILNSSLNKVYKVTWGQCPLNSQSCMYHCNLRYGTIIKLI